MNSASYVLRLFALIWKESSKGKRNELRAVAAFEDGTSDIPDWFISIENASARLDRAGIDVVLKTDVGHVFVQIKSHPRKALLFRSDQEKGRYRKDIGIAVLQEHFTPREVRRAIIKAAEPEYRRILAKLSSRCGATFIPAEALPQ